MAKFTVRADELIDAMQNNDYSANHYFDTELGDIIFTSEYVDLDEETAALLETERERFIEVDRVPSRDAWRIMDDFAETVANGRIRDNLLRALGGKGAFRRFKDTLYDYPDVRQQWFIYQERRYMELAQEWVEMNELDIELVPFHPENKTQAPPSPAADKKLLILFGPPAVGKMTVGKELSEMTGLKLFHNHMTIELVLLFFEFGSPPFGRLVGEFRCMILEEVAQSDLPGLIFTYVWALDQESDREFIDSLTDIFQQVGADIFYVELRASQEERLARNKTEYRLSQKPTKRDLDFSEQNLLESDTTYQLNSEGDFFYQSNYLKIDNTHLSAKETAQQIKAHFGW
ncbi:MAG: AAA family ATPase [Chloroflexi bacterium]|nr:AAA family ATPase [Chloroflexota bacterium]